jgi:peroxiredoxin
MKWLILAFAVLAVFLVWRGMAVGAKVPKVGEAAPAFWLPDQNGRVRSLSDFGATWLVLYFFPRADTPG